MAVKFESEEELQKYIDNLGTEYKFSCLKEKNAEGCHLLGDYLEAVKKDFKAAAKIYKSNCDERKYAKSCFKFGNLSYLGKGCPIDNKASLDYYNQACELGFMKACLNAGLILTHPTKDPETKEPFMKEDNVAGVSYMEKACSNGLPIACYYASGIYITGREGVPRDIVKASQLSETACEGGNIYACMNLSQMYRRGDGVEKDESKATLYKEKAKEIRDDMRKKSAIGLQQYA